tara:strand:+ start:9413 stop:10168 length:756 start_codon:yes stop_codon:yes gene_type:complete
MAGHNKWSKVKHIKAREDAKKGKAFSKLSKEISIAARDGGGDPSMNPRLRTAIDAAKSVSMPKDNIERAIKKGTGELGGDAIEEVTYEGFGPSGVALIVEVSTDNKNRSVADIRSIFNKANGTMGTTGSVSHLFRRLGEIRVDLSAIEEDKLLEICLEAGAEEVANDEEDHIVQTAPDALNEVASAIIQEGIDLKSQNLVYVPEVSMAIDDASQASKVVRLFETLDEYDDTLNVFANFDIPEAILEEALAN